jgi:hypothetical protein
MGNLAVIDGSLLAFRASAAGEKRTILVTHRKTKKQKEFEGRNKFKEYLKELNVKREESKKSPLLITDYEIEDVLHPVEIKISKHVLHQMIQYILTACDADEYIIYLDEGATFRHKLATVQEYKGNRVNNIKPTNLQAIKETLVLKYNAKTITDLEADDYLNFWQYKGWKKTKKGSKEKIIAVTFDKDAFGNPGWVFDFRKDDEGKPLMDKPIFIDGLGHLVEKENKDIKGVGRKFFYFQVLYGDDADNYKSNKLSKSRYGKKKAYLALKDCKSDKDCLQVVVNQFKEWYPEATTYLTWDGKEVTKTWLELLQEYWDLARMKRSVEDDVSVLF